MQFETVIYCKTGPVAEIRFNRPLRLNAVIKQLYDELLVALADSEADDEIRCVVLTGEGRAFCVGADLKEHGKGERTPYQMRQYLKGEQEVCQRIYSFPKPVIAAVNGFAIGAGAELAVVADFLVMAEGAQLGFPEVSIGTFIGGGVSHLLPQLVGLVKARELIMLGQRIDGREAKRIGLASRVFPDASFREDVAAFAEELGGKAPLSLAMAKEHLNKGITRGMDSALKTELEAVTFCTTTEDWREGVKAFAEKRRPVFKGK
jgi:enoyl-CoA hydratase